MHRRTPLRCKRNIQNSHTESSMAVLYVGEPVGTAGNNVQGLLPDGTQVRGGAQRKLFGGEWGNRLCDVLLVRFPGSGERGECDGVFSHQSKGSFLFRFAHLSTKSSKESPALPNRRTAPPRRRSLWFS